MSKIELTEEEKDNICRAYRNYYCLSINHIAEDDEVAKQVFIKCGIIKEDE